MLGHYDRAVDKALSRPVATVVVIMASFVLSLALVPLLGLAFFPRTDPGQFVINVKAPAGSRLEMTNQYIAQVENDIRDVVAPHDLQMIVSNIGMTPDLSAIYTSNSAQHTAFVQVSLNQEHKTSTFTYMNRVRRRLAPTCPNSQRIFRRAGLVDSVVNAGMPAPIDIQVTGNNQEAAYQVASEMAAKLRRLHSCKRCADSPGPGLSRDSA